MSSLDVLDRQTNVDWVYNILRESRVSEELIEYLKSTSFADDPASIKYHSNYPGGLVAHSIGVLKYLKALNSLLPKEARYPVEVIARAALLHDLCKANSYVYKEAWRKNDKGKWESYPSWAYRESDFAYGHGELSVELIRKYKTKITDDEAMAIRFHMGAYQLQGMELMAYQNAVAACPLVLMLHTADMMEASFDANPKFLKWVESKRGDADGFPVR